MSSQLENSTSFQSSDRFHFTAAETAQELSDRFLFPSFSYVSGIWIRPFATMSVWCINPQRCWQFSAK